jgi:hypothetical protein
MGLGSTASADQTAGVAGGSDALPPQEGRLAAGTCHVINNLFKRLNPQGDFVIVPLQEAVNDPQCPQLRDYGRIKSAYFELSNRAAHPKCKDLDPRNAVVGTVCATEKGGIFKRYQHPTSGELGWQDQEAGGVVWFDEAYTDVHHYRAQEICQRLNHSLPNRQEFRAAFNRGLSELTRDPSDRELHYWSREIGADYPERNEPRESFAYTSSSYGYTGFGVRRNSAGRQLRARCVELPGNHQ